MTTRNPPATALLLAFAYAMLGTSAGCKPLKTGAKESFAKKYSCPEERVEVRARDDLRYGDLVLRGAAQENAPDEVKKDAGRYAKWQKDQREKDADLRKFLDENDVFEARGCGREALLGCGRASHGDGVSLTEVNCWEAPKPR